MGNQKSLDTDGIWKEIVAPKDETYIKLEVGEILIGFFVSSVESEIYDGNLIHTFQKRDTDEIVKINGTVNLDRKLSMVDNGDLLRIERLEDKKMKPPKNDLQIYHVDKWIKK